MVRSALGKEQIDEVIKVSETYFDDSKCYMLGCVPQVVLILRYRQGYLQIRRKGRRDQTHRGTSTATSCSCGAIRAS